PVGAGQDSLAMRCPAGFVVDEKSNIDSADVARGSFSSLPGSLLVGITVKNQGDKGRMRRSIRSAAAPHYRIPYSL
ncbi:hypothetical protein COL27_28495, partial [Bacillus sp. AFS075960]